MLVISTSYKMPRGIKRTAEAEDDPIDPTTTDDDARGGTEYTSAVALFKVLGGG